MVIRHHRKLPLGEPLWWGAQWMNLFGALNITTQAGTIDRVFLTPFYFPRAAVVSILVFRQQGGGGASTNFRLGFYADNGGTPAGGALLETSGDIDATGTGPGEFTLSTARRFERGITWAALITEDALIDFSRSNSTLFFTEIGNEDMRSCRYQAASPVEFDDPCPAVTGDGIARFHAWARLVWGE